MFKVELLLVFALWQGGMTWAQRPQEPGRVIGKVSTEGNLIIMELDEGVLGKANLFDLAGRTLRFIPEGRGYRVENVGLQWDSEFGAELTGSQVTLRNFKFPYSGKSWDAFSVGTNGSIAVEGPRLPAVDQSQKNFNTGIVLVVEHGNKPSRELIERGNGIREAWIDYWATTTGHRSSMTVNPKPGETQSQ